MGMGGFWGSLGTTEGEERRLKGYPIRLRRGERAAEGERGREKTGLPGARCKPSSTRENPNKKQESVDADDPTSASSRHAPYGALKCPVSARQTGAVMTYGTVIPRRPKTFLGYPRLTGRSFSSSLRCCCFFFLFISASLASGAALLSILRLTFSASLHIFISLSLSIYIPTLTPPPLS